MRLRLGVVALWWFSLSEMGRAQVVQQPTPEGARPQPRPANAELAFAAVLSRALEHFEARRYAEARTLFDDAVEIAPPGTDLATLKFNAAVSAYELGQFSDAERRFSEVAEMARLSGTDSELGALATIHAGLAALRRGDLERAERQLLDSANTPTEAEALRRELKERLEEARRAAGERGFRTRFEHGIAAFKRKAWQESEASLVAALEFQDSATPDELGSLYYILSEIALERGDLALAKERAERSVAFDPGDGYLRANRGDVALAERDLAVAERSYTEALELGLEPGDVERVERDLAAIYPVRRRGAHGFAASGAGYDSNASQSGIAEALAASTAAPGQGSVFFTLTGLAGYAFKASRQLAWEPFYAVDWLVLFDDPVRELSLQSHEAGLNLDWAPSYEVDLTTTASANLLLTGLDSLEPFSFEGLLGFELEWATSRAFKTLAGLEGRAIEGFSGRDYLTGARIDAELGEEWRFGRGLWRFGVAYRYNGIGTQTLPLNSDLLFFCNSNLPVAMGFCINSIYEIPLGYQGPIAETALRYSPLSRWVVEGNLRFEFRRYLDESFIEGPGPPIFAQGINRKTRQDLRYRLGVSSELELDRTGTFAAVGTYSVLFSTSNIAFQAGDPEHFLDYDDRNFTQHIVDLTLQARF